MLVSQDTSRKSTGKQPNDDSAKAETIMTSLNYLFPAVESPKAPKRESKGYDTFSDALPLVPQISNISVSIPASSQTTRRNESAIQVASSILPPINVVPMKISNSPKASARSQLSNTNKTLPSPSSVSSSNSSAAFTSSFKKKKNSPSSSSNSSSSATYASRFNYNQSMNHLQVPNPQLPTRSYSPIPSKAIPLTTREMQTNIYKNKALQSMSIQNFALASYYCKVAQVHNKKDPELIKLREALDKMNIK